MALFNAIVNRFRPGRLRPRSARASEDYQVPGEPLRDVDSAWHDAQVAVRQHEAFSGLLRDLRDGRPRRDFVALAEALRLTALDDPTVLEVGCGSGYYSEALTLLRGKPLRYTGVDLSPAMIELARKAYPTMEFHVGDAAALSFPDASFDVAISGCSLMHIADYPAAIREVRRVSARFCVFHTVPVMLRRATTQLHKRAYGEPTLEIVFNEGELLDRFVACGLSLVTELPNIVYDLRDVLGEETLTKTYLCRVTK